MRRLALAAALLPCLALAQSAPAAAPGASTPPAKVIVDAGGWLVLQGTRNFGRLNATDLPMFASAAGGESNAGLNARQSRVRFNLGVPTDGLLAGSAMKGLLELDFMGPGVNADPSLPVVRLRHAWVAVTWKEKANLTVMAGQNWNLFYGPLVPVSLGHLAVPRFGGAGFLFRRAPQVRVAVDVGAPVALVAAVAALAPMDRQTTQGGILVGERSGTPEGEARLAASYRPGGKPLAEVGASARYATHRWRLDGATPVHDVDVASWGAAVDAKLERGVVLVQGAAFVGEGLTAYGSIAPGERLTAGTATSVADADAVRTRGGFAQVVVTPVKPVQVFVGAGIEAPKRGDLPATTGSGASLAPTVTKNRQLSGGALVSVSSRWRVALEGTGYWTDLYDGTDRSATQVELTSLLAF